jgi:hypothetical protein
VSYFVSLGDDCPRRICTHLGVDCDTHDCESHKTNVKKAYLYFTQSICSVFESSVQKVERDDFTFVDLLPVMQQLKTKIESRIADKFFGSKV